VKRTVVVTRSRQTAETLGQVARSPFTPQPPYALSKTNTHIVTWTSRARAYDALGQIATLPGPLHLVAWALHPGNPVIAAAHFEIQTEDPAAAHKILNSLGLAPLLAFDSPRLDALTVASSPDIAPYAHTRVPTSTGPRDLVALVIAMATRVGIEPALALAIVDTESKFDIHAMNAHSGAKGLMQLMDNTAAEMNLHDPFDPEENLRAGLGYLAKMIAKTATLEDAIVAYHSGRGSLMKRGHTEADRLYLATIQTKHEMYAIQLHMRKDPP